MVKYYYPQKYLRYFIRFVKMYGCYEPHILGWCISCLTSPVELMSHYLESQESLIIYRALKVRLWHEYITPHIIEDVRLFFHKKYNIFIDQCDENIIKKNIIKERFSDALRIIYNNHEIRLESFITYTFIKFLMDNEKRNSIHQ